MTALLEVCRICLADGVRMFKILNTNLQEVYEKLTDISLSNEDGSPLYACYICHAYLKKCYNFRMKSLRANEALNRLFLNHIEITYESIKLIDRGMFNLVDNFSVTLLEDQNKSHLNQDIQRIVSIKCEPVVTEDKDSNRTDEIEERYRQWNYKFDQDFKQYSDSEEDIPLKNAGLKKEVFLESNISCDQLIPEERKRCTLREKSDISGTLLDKKPKLEVHEEWITQCRAEEAATTIVKDIKKTDEKNINLSVNSSDTKTAIVDVAKNKNRQTKNTTIKTKNKIVKNSNNQNDNNNEKNKSLFICFNCGKECLTKIDLTTHIESHKCQNKDIYFKCDTCSYKCVTKDSLSKHLVLHDKNRPFVCEHCGYRFVRKFLLQRHLKTHTRDKSCVCNICEYKCKDKSNLMRHLKIHSGVKPYACNICEYKCIRKSHLTTHLKRHSGDKPYACNICDYKCITKGHLSRHLQTHSEAKPHACNLCKYTCIQKYKLIRHLKLHSGDKPYACNFCEYKCVDKSNLVAHLQIHSGKQHACHICEYKCARKENLITHFKKHSVVKPYACNICEYKSNFKGNLKNHLKSKHKIQAKNNKIN